MVRRRKGWRGPSSAGERKSAEEERAFSPEHIRRPSPEYSPMSRSPLCGFEAGAREGVSLERGRLRSRKKHAKKASSRSRSRSLEFADSPSSSIGNGRRRRKKAKERHKKRHRNKKSSRRSVSPSPLVVGVGAFPAGAGGLQQATKTAKAKAEQPAGRLAAPEEDEDIVIFDRTTRAFTAAVSRPKESPVGPPPPGGSGGLGTPHNTASPDIRCSLDALNYRKAFGLSAGGYSFVCESIAAPPGEAPATANVMAVKGKGPGGAAPWATGGLLTSSLTREKTTDELQKESKINPKTHPHLYWSCWKCSTLNYKTRHQCHKCNRLFQR